MPAAQETSEPRSAHVGLTPPITFPTWKKYTIMGRAIGSLDVCSKRRMFAAIRNTAGMTCDHYNPRCGITFGEFATWYNLNGKKRKDASSKTAK